MRVHRAVAMLQELAARWRAATLLLDEATKAHTRAANQITDEQRIAAQACARARFPSCLPPSPVLSPLRRTSRLFALLALAPAPSRSNSFVALSAGAFACPLMRPLLPMPEPCELRACPHAGGAWRALPIAVGAPRGAGAAEPRPARTCRGSRHTRPRRAGPPGWEASGQKGRLRAMKPTTPGHARK